MHHAAVFQNHAGAENHMRLNQNVAADLGVKAHEHGLGRNHTGPRPHGALPQAALHHGFGGGQLHPVVDAHGVFFGRHHGDTSQATLAGGLHGIGEVEFFLRIVGPDGVQQLQSAASVERHNACVAGGHGELVGARVLLLADRLKRAAV